MLLNFFHLFEFAICKDPVVIQLGLPAFVTGSNSAVTPGKEIFVLLSETQLPTLSKQPTGYILPVLNSVE